MIGSTIGHYRIESKLGEGGMGVVYKATDTKLDRTVALKFLPPQASEREETKARFLQEAKAAASLNHPGICTVHGVEEADDKMFIVMEYVDGGTLRRSIDNRQLTIDNSIGLAVSIGEALHEAHAKSIVHRDIKADNVMLNARGEAKIMDFGLAKLKGTLKLTRTSSTVGTLAYMAPEQIQGGEVDARSDIFAFGVLLFEMLTGKLPFRGEHEAAMMYSLLNEPPESLTSYLPDASPELVHVLNRALEKDPGDRYQSVSEMVIDLRRLKRDTTKVYKTASVPPPPPSDGHHRSAKPSPARTTSVTINIPSVEKKPVAIVGGIVAIIIVAVGLFLFLGDPEPEGRIPIAVADFVNETNEPELNSLSGMLITSLEQSNRLSVAPRARMFDILKQLGRADATRIDESLGKEIAKQANIGALVIASIRKFGRLYTIDLKVLDTRTNEYLFTTKEQGEGQESIPGLLDELAERTQSSLRVPVDQMADAPKIANVTTTNMEAYAHYFRGEDLISKIKMDDAIPELEAAIAIDPTFGLAYLRLGYAQKWRQRNDLARAPYEKAMELIDRIPAREQYFVRSGLLDLNGDAPGAIAILKEAERAFPLDKEIPYEIGDMEYHEGQIRESIASLEKTLSMDPTFERALEHLAWGYRNQMQFDKLKDVAERYAMVSDTSEARTLLFQAYCGLKQYDDALSIVEDPRSSFTVGQKSSYRSLIRLLKRDYDGAVREGEERLRSSSTPRAMRSAQSALAMMYPYQGKYRKTFEALDKAYDLSMAIGDTSQAMYYRSRKAHAIWMSYGSADETQAAIGSTIPYESAVTFPPYWGFRAWVAAMQGDTSGLNTTLQNAGALPGSFRRWFSAHVALNQNDPTKALALLDTVLNEGGFGIDLYPDVLYLKARVLMQSGSYEAAIKTLETIETIPSNEFGVRAIILPNAFNLLGKAYENSGNKATAKAAYEKLLVIWKNADPDLPMLIDTKKRLEALR